MTSLIAKSSSISFAALVVFLLTQDEYIPIFCVGVILGVAWEVTMPWKENEDE